MERGAVCAELWKRDPPRHATVCFAAAEDQHSRLELAGSEKLMGLKFSLMGKSARHSSMELVHDVIPGSETKKSSCLRQQQCPQFPG